MLELINICKTYQMGETQVNALCNVSLKIKQGEFVAIMGPSGSGKSTLLHVLGFLDRADSGEYLVSDKNISQFSDDDLANLRNSLAGFIFQQFHLLSRLTALENTELPLIYGGHTRSKQRAEEKIKAVGLIERIQHRPNELSGGQQQRVAIARALVNDPPVIFADEPTGNLDTTSEKEILDILKKLNDEGKAVLIVTHEPEIAAQTNRIIRMRDGKIISDEKTGARPQTKTPVQESPSLPQNLQRQRPFYTPTELLDGVFQGFKSIWSNKLRSLLSMLGILIGVASVITMLALGEGAKESIRQRLSSMGTNVLTVSPGSHRMSEISLEAGSVTRFTLKDVDVMAEVTHVKATSPTVAGRGQLVYASENWNTQVLGVGVNYAKMKDSEPLAGRFFSDDEVTRREKVALIGLTIVKELFDNKNPVGEILKINRINFTVVGVLPEKGASPHGDRDDVVVIPITTAMFRILGKDYIDSIDVEIDSLDNIEAAKERISNLIIQRHRLSPDDRDSFTIRNMAEIQQALQGMTQTMTLLLGFVGAISLLVGGIGIMNIMLVSVTERTREIGLRKALGARKKDIMLQFLTESVVMTFCGGMVGITFGTLITITLTYAVDWMMKISFLSVMISTIFSVIVGLIFGVWPARKAAQLNPIDALRHE
ncbi:MAG: ABC transporter permease [Deltaproteobacteria bacterium]|nr:ABC transporter permease [Deltaproteobacteria bacterium]